MTGSGNPTALRIDDLDGHQGNVFAIGGDAAAVGTKHDARRRAGRLPLVGKYQSVTIKAFCFKQARLISHFPHQMCIASRGLGAEALAIEKQLHALRVAVDPDFDLPALLARPVPVREEMQHGLRSPPCLVIVKVVLGETAHIHNAEMGVDTRPSVGSGLAAVIESRPGKAARQERARVVKLPPDFGSGCPGGLFRVIGLFPAPASGRPNSLACTRPSAGSISTDKWSTSSGLRSAFAISTSARTRGSCSTGGPSR